MFSLQNSHSKDYAKERLLNVLLAERMGCSPQILLMLKNDLSLAVEKYFNVDTSSIRIQYLAQKHCIQTEIHIMDALESEQKND